MDPYNGPLDNPAWCLVDAEQRVVASIRAETALEARDIFRREGLSGVRVVRAKDAPVVEVASGARCEGCGRLVDEATDYRRVTGWERISRSAGGTNAIRAPDRSAEEFMCMFCTDKVANGVSLQQETLAI